MKKIVYFVVGLLIFTSFTAISIGKKADFDQKSTQTQTFIEKIFNTPSIVQKEIYENTYTELRIEGTNGYLNIVNAPIVPLSKTTLNLPFGSKIIDISYEIGEIETIQLKNKITPQPKPIPTNMVNAKAEYTMDSSIYESSDLYPEDWFDYFVGGGLDENSNYKTFLTIRTFPARYSPINNIIQYTNDIKLKITYEKPMKNPIPEINSYDLVIITPSQFTSELNRLVTHKNKYGIQSTIKTLEDIYSEYTGVDKPEQIKYYIKDAIETQGIKYVMLVGGMNSLISGEPRDDTNQGSKDWYFPVRYTNLREMGGTYDPGFISDLYYADIYNGDGSFSSWDSDKNGESDGVFARWKMFGDRDYIDFYPDVYVGRLACRSKTEVKNVVTKIIDYERLKHGSDWYENMVVIGGDSHDDSGTDYIEGEVACDYVLENYMTEFNPVKLYASYKESDPNHVPSPSNIQRDVTAGCGFLLFEGHGHPGSWNTHWPGIFEWDDSPGGIDVTYFNGLKNGKNLPICVIGGCHNSQFNVTLMATTLEEPFMWTHGMPVAECFAWHLVRLANGGTIASFGNTGLGYGAVGDHGDRDGDGEDLPDTLEALGGYQIKVFFKSVDEGKYILGEAWGDSVRKYLDTFPGMSDQSDAKTVEQWPLLGDPSLKIGGYQTDDRARSKNIEKFPLLIEWIKQYPILERILRL